MRTIIALPLLALAACQVTEDDQNDAITVQYNEDVAANAAEDIGNAAQEAGEAIANGAEEAVDTARNVDVDVDTNTADNEPTTNSN
ncbi:MAG TPA: hypothetical protein VJ763_09970 [Sphingomicrobium sp.]|jgi:hypothetical protein|nr:hypothetical protein [Sphingomicrobium sp.]